MSADPAGGGAAPDRLEAIVRGRVQGVGFRYHVLRQAIALGLTGWVRNEPDGAVRCVAEGPTSALETLVERLRTGPAGARVDEVDTTWSRASGGLSRFTITSGSHPGD